jgi:hypothetical protein
MRPFSVLENTRFTNLFKGLDLLLHDYFPHTFCPETFTSEKQSAFYSNMAAFKQLQKKTKTMDKITKQYSIYFISETFNTVITSNVFSFNTFTLYKKDMKARCKQYFNLISFNPNLKWCIFTLHLSLLQNDQSSAHT